ncbi:type VI secretion system Vgr family protein [Proteus sp. NMG38-2]|uniref:type VI secretion system Vgr family protein n=1 Tax=Proteus sp. NMG38-2 TaxID=2883107 RepID=UPI0039B4BF0C
MAFLLFILINEWGGIRAGKGLFISADEQPKAQGEVVDMDAALKEIAHLLQQREQLNIAAKQARPCKRILKAKDNCYSNVWSR